MAGEASFGEAFPPRTAAPGNSRKEKIQTLEASQGEVKIWLPVTNSGRTMDAEATQ